MWYTFRPGGPWGRSQYTLIYSCFSSSGTSKKWWSKNIVGLLIYGKDLKFPANQLRLPGQTSPFSVDASKPKAIVSGLNPPFTKHLPDFFCSLHQSSNPGILPNDYVIKYFIYIMIFNVYRKNDTAQSCTIPAVTVSSPHSKAPSNRASSSAPTRAKQSAAEKTKPESMAPAECGAPVDWVCSQSWRFFCVLTSKNEAFTNSLIRICGWFACLLTVGSEKSVALEILRGFMVEI